MRLKFILQLALSLITGMQVFAQTVPPPVIDTMNYHAPGLTMHEINNHIRSLLQPRDTAEGGKATQANFAIQFWHKRAHHNDSSGISMFDNYMRMLRHDAIARNASLCQSTGGFSGA